MDKYIGRLLDRRYEIIELIGAGGMANVYRASDHRLGRMVAVKILKEDLSRDPEFRRRFHGESQAIAMLSHPNIVSVFDVSHSDEADFIVMELIDGLTLHDYMQSKGKLNWRETLHFTTQIARALEHAHSRGIIHRDIKPHNIMILKDGSVKVADFGIARVASSQHTMTREALGSVHYISPEQARGAASDRRSDLYSLGVVMYEMLTGKPPYEGETPVSVALQHISGKLRRPTELNPDIPAGMEQIILRLMEVDPLLRYQNASDLLRDLEQFRINPAIIFGLPMNTGTAEKAGPSRQEVRRVPADVEQRRAERKQREEQRRKRRKRNRVLFLIAAVLIALLLCGLLVYRFVLKDLFQPEESYTMPDLTGINVSELDTDAYPWLSFSEKWVQNDTVPAGEIFDQSPEAGRTVKGSAEAVLTISSGTQTESMPEVDGISKDAAIRALNDLGLTLDIQTEETYDPETTVGYVISTDPAAGAELRNGSTVVLHVSLGPEEEEMAEVPDLIGKTLDEALELLEEAGLERGTIQHVENDEPEGTVLFQGISAGLQVVPGTEINLQVSRGPAEETDSGEEETEDTSEEETDPDETGTQAAEASGDTGAGTETQNEETAAPAEQPQMETVYVEVPLPAQEGTVSVEIRLDGNLYDSFDVDCADMSFTEIVSGSGSQLLEVYYDGSLSYSEMIDFNG